MALWRFLGHCPPKPPSYDVTVEQIARLQGHFAAIREAGQSKSIFVSYDGVTQVFYTVYKGNFYWGTTVTEVIDAAGLDWQWNYDALGDISTFGHLLDRETLHPCVSRVGAGELLIWNGRSLTRTVLPPPHISDAATPESAVNILVSSVSRQTHPDDVISISGGFDSRLILAAHLALGLKPRLLVMGSAEATDVVIASAMAKRLGLEIRRVQLTGKYMLRDRFEISRETSGTKTVENWHTYEYVAASGHTEGIWVGSNGEFARTFYVDRGAAFLAADAMGRIGIDKFWNAKLNRTAIPPTLISYLSHEFAERLFSGNRKARLQSLFPQSSLGTLNDALYLERVRQFISNGLRLMSMHASPKTPFLDPRWIAVIRGLPRRDKLGNRWHRFAISKLAPALLEFPFDATGVPMGTGPGVRYWLGLSPHSVNVPYFQYGPFFAGPEFVEILNQALPFVADLFGSSIVKSNLSVRSMAFLAALAIFRQMAQQEPLAASPGYSRQMSSSRS